MKNGRGVIRPPNGVKNWGDIIIEVNYSSISLQDI